MYEGKPGEASFANNCLLARRLVERGVRHIELSDSDGDHHSGLKTRLPAKCKDVDQAIAVLIRDLKARDLLSETLIVWGSEFGRTPLSQGGDGKSKDVPGRDHHKDAYTMWLPAVASKAESHTAEPMISEWTSLSHQFTSTISTPPSCIFWGSTTND
jgi:hypothetical protein